ncbi:hypothetical protein ABES02_13715 [Neobacillus pocheonensis]|uniref:hypothetical protein n=1 Tax=Neobacillus pocheonensis TaxID=363869 RepID=UPI003D2B9EE5
MRSEDVQRIQWGVSRQPQPPRLQSFHPRGLVFGPDGLLYVSAIDFLNPTKGWVLRVLRFDTKKNKLVDVFISNDDVEDLH